MIKMKRFAVAGLAVTMAFGTLGCGKTASDQKAEDVKQVETEHEVHKIGVAVYSDTDDEVNMFRDYYRNYLENSFSVEFVYSPAIADLEGEKAFVDSAKEAGCEGIISFMATDLDEIVKYCGDDFYYVYGSGSFSKEEIEAASQYDNFLGVVGPSDEMEAAAGANMIKSLGAEDGSSKTYLIMSGGSSIGNFMHATRTTAMLQTLQDEYGFTFNAPVEEVALSPQNTDVVATTPEGGKVYINPGYMMVDKSSFEEIIKICEPDVIASACNGAAVAEDILNKETEMNKHIKVGVVDCFCEANHQHFINQDQFGDSELNFLEGKCAANACPAFVAMYNAVTGHKDIVLNDGKPFVLNQDFMQATDLTSYEELSAKAENVFDNIYTTQDIMNVLGEYNEEANYDDFVQFVDQVNK